MKKTQNEIREAVLQALHHIVPEVDLITLDPNTNLRDELDIDSMDFLRLMVKLHDSLNIDIPESDYKKLTTLNTCVDYINTKINLTK